MCFYLFIQKFSPFTDFVKSQHWFVKLNGKHFTYLNSSVSRNCLVYALIHNFSRRGASDIALWLLLFIPRATCMKTYFFEYTQWLRVAKYIRVMQAEFYFFLKREIMVKYQTNHLRWKHRSRKCRVRLWQQEEKVWIKMIRKRNRLQKCSPQKSDILSTFLSIVPLKINLICLGDLNKT